MQKMNHCTSEKSLEESLEEYLEARSEQMWENPVLVSFWDGEDVLFQSGPADFFRSTRLQQIITWDIEEDICGPWETDASKIVRAVADDLIKDSLYEMSGFEVYS